MEAAAHGRTHRQAAKRAEILAIAKEIFLRDGYGRASMDQVHTRLGGSKRTLYSHFPTKEALFAAIVEQVSDRVLAALRPPLECEDLRGTLVRMGTDYLNVLLSPDGLALYRAMVSEAPHFPELASTFFENGPARASRHLAAFFREQRSRHRISVADPELAAEQFLGMVRSNVHLAAALSARRPSKRRIETTVDQAVDTFLRGVTASPGPRGAGGDR